MQICSYLTIFNVKIHKVGYDGLMAIISYSIKDTQAISITYVTANSLNLLFNNGKLTNIFNQFDYIHPDGSGLYIALKILYGKNGLRKKITGSDFYPLLIKEAVKNNWRIFLFGDTDETLSKAISKNSNLKICGVQSGFNFINEDVVKKINESATDVLVVGLGCPKQEVWIIENKSKLSAKVILAVGDGIKVFAGTKKRGNLIIQILGLEWLIRLIFNPKNYWKRYLIGNPLFLLRVLKYKFHF